MKKWMNERRLNSTDKSATVWSIGNGKRFDYFSHVEGRLFAYSKIRIQLDQNFLLSLRIFSIQGQFSMKGRFVNNTGWFNYQGVNINVISDECAREEGPNNYFAGKGKTRHGLQAGAYCVERKGYLRGSVARGSHLGLWINPVQSSISHRTLFNFPTLAVVHARHVNYQEQSLAPDRSQQPSVDELF